MAIRSFANRATRRFAKGDPRRLPPHLVPRLSAILGLLDNPAEIPLASCHLHCRSGLSGDRKGTYAVALSGPGASSSASTTATSMM